MSSFLTTLIITIVLVGMALVALAIGLILTGKSRLRRGSCGMDPTKLRDKSCDKEKQSGCGLCGKKDEDEL